VNWFLARCNESSNFLRRKKSMRTLQSPFGHFYAPHRIVKAEKVGSLPPVLVVFRPLFLNFLVRTSPCLRDLNLERVKTLVQTMLQSEILTFFTKKLR
jgi:hypothetical protein